MKTHKNLYPLIYNFENLYTAYLKARKGKRSKKAVITYETRIEENLIILQNELIYNMFQTSKYKCFLIKEPKERLIMALPFKDRVCQHAIINIVEPIFERIFHNESYACRVGKGVIAAVEKLKINMNIVGSESFYLKGDISKFFYNINHNVLKSLIKKKISCKQTLLIQNKIIDSTGEEIGLPIGNLTSQLYANLYLNELDNFVKHQLKAKFYIRYMDDFTILHKDKDVLKFYLSEIESFLQSKLKLTLNKKTQINKICRGISFLGYRNFIHYRVIKPKNWQRNKRKFKLFGRKLPEGLITQEKINRSLASFKGYIKWCHGQRKLNSVLSYLKTNNYVQT